MCRSRSSPGLGAGSRHGPMDSTGNRPRHRPRLDGHGPAEPDAHDAHELGQAGHQVPGGPPLIHTFRAYPHQDLVVADGGAERSQSKQQDVFACGTVFGLHDRLHQPRRTAGVGVGSIE